MDNRDAEVIKFMRTLTDYMQTHHIIVPEFPRISYPNPFDQLIEHPDVQRLLSVWMKHNNTLQLLYILETLPNMLQQKSEDDQATILNRFFEYAHSIRTWIPEKNDYDLAIESVQKQLDEDVKPAQSIKDAAIERWADFNRPLYDLNESDIARLRKYTFFINGDIFSANTVLDMDPETCTEFDARVKQIIKEHANFLLPENNDLRKLNPAIFQDELFARIKKDPHIIALLDNIKPWVPVVPERPKIKQETRKKPTPPASPVPNPMPREPIVEERKPTPVDETRDMDLNALLGLNESDDDSTVDTTDHEITASSDNNSLAISSETEDKSTSSLSFWQKFNIESNEDLAALIELEIMQPHQVPDRALTTKDEQHYAHLVERIIQASLHSDKTSSQADKRIDHSTPSNSTRAHQTTPRQPIPSENVSQSVRRKPFIPVIKDDTYNTELQKYNRDKRQLDYVTGKDLSKKMQIQS